MQQSNFLSRWGSGHGVCPFLALRWLRKMPPVYQGCQPSLGTFLHPNGNRHSITIWIALWYSQAHAPGYFSCSFFCRLKSARRASSVQSREVSVCWKVGWCARKLVNWIRFLAWKATRDLNVPFSVSWHKDVFKSNMCHLGWWSGIDWASQSNLAEQNTFF